MSRRAAVAAGLGAIITADVLAARRGAPVSASIARDLDRVIHVAADGDDAAQGRSADAPMLTISAALRRLGHRGGTVRLRAGDEFPTTQSLVVDVARHRIVGDRSTIVAADLPPWAPVVHLVATEPQPLLQPWTVLDGLSIRGAGRGSDSVGLLLDQPPTPGKAAVAHITIRSVAIAECGVGVRFGDNAYCVTFAGCVVAKCDTAVLVAEDTVNAGERLHFDGCTVFDSDTGFDIRSRAAEVMLIGSSLDYCTRLIDVAEGRVHLIGCHVEFDKSREVEPMRVAGRTGGLVMIGGKLTATTRGDLTVPAVLRNDADDGAASSFTSVWMANLATTSGDLSVGKGRTIVVGEATPSVPYRSFTVVGESNNLLMDGRFAETDLLDHWLTSGATLRTGDGDHGQARELGVRGEEGRGAAVAQVVVPTPPSSILRGRLLARPTAGQGSAEVAFLAAVVRGDRVVRAVELGSPTALDLASDREQWTTIRSPLPIVRPPVWATHLVVRITLIDASSDASLAIADLNLCAT